MKFLCIVSQNEGHLDFGGGGFLVLAKELQKKGHEVIWMARGATTEILADKGWVLSSASSISSVTNPQNMLNDNTHLKILCNEIKCFYSELQNIQYDFCLVDRSLGVTTMVLKSLNILYACIGTPGGNWGRDENGVVPLNFPCKDYQNLGQWLCNEFDWMSAPLDSWWQPSPHLNIVFVGRSFYPALADSKTSAFVNLHKALTSNTKLNRDRLGITFGHTGNIAPLLHILDLLKNDEDIEISKTDIFAGGRPGLLDKLRLENEKLCLHERVPYEHVFSELYGVICFGGIGTLWHVLQNRIPSLVIQGGAGDQYFNAKQMENLGIAKLWSGKNEEITSAKYTFDRLMQINYSAAFNDYHLPQNFNNDLQTLVIKLESFFSS